MGCLGRRGRRPRDLHHVEPRAGAGELLLNCIDNDGQNAGYDLPLTRQVKQAVSIPVIASSGAGAPAHFSEVFVEAGVEAALAASIFHRNLVSIPDVKAHLDEKGIAARRAAAA